MEISGVPIEDWYAIVKEVSDKLYDGNVIVGGNEYQSGRRILRATLKVSNSYGSGSRVSWTGRHMPAACWHAFRDVLAELFDRFPNAKVRTAMAYYNGKDGFEREYPATGDVNIGSMMQPATMPELCECF